MTTSTPSINPYTTLESSLLSHFYLSNPGSSFIPQLYALSVILAILSLSCIITFLVRWRKGQVWFFRIVVTCKGSWLNPNLLMVWNGFGLIYCLVLQGYIYANIRLASPNYDSDLTGIMGWRLLVWLPLLLGGFCNVWATLLATILPRTPSRLNRFDLARYPILVNSFFIIIPILLLSAIIPAIVIINNKFNQAYQLAKELQIILEQASDLFVQKGIITDLVGFNQSILSLENLFKGLYVYWERVWILYAVFVGICWIIYMGAAYVHWRQIQHSLFILRSKISSRGNDRAQIKSLEWALMSTILTGALTIAMCFCYFVVLIILASKSVEMANNGKLSKIVGLASVYIYVLFGGIATVAILIRSFMRPPVALVTSISSGSMKLTQMSNRPPAANGSTSMRSDNDLEEGTGETLDVQLEKWNSGSGKSIEVGSRPDIIEVGRY